MHPLPRRTLTAVIAATLLAGCGGAPVAEVEREQLPGGAVIERAEQAGGELAIRAALDQAASLQQLGAEGVVLIVHTQPRCGPADEMLGTDAVAIEVAAELSGAPVGQRFDLPAPMPAPLALATTLPVEELASFHCG